MHELHLMAQVIKAVEAKLSEVGGSKLSTVRLKVSASSHMLAHQSALQTAFLSAARGTKAEGAILEIIPVPSHAWCPGCHRETPVAGPEDSCSTCGGIVIVPAEPEVVLHELVVRE